MSRARRALRWWFADQSDRPGYTLLMMLAFVSWASGDDTPLWVRIALLVSAAACAAELIRVAVERRRGRRAEGTA
ncbi:hypothetical protein ACFVU3_08275 [Streptomyces sp. NPDC058052]|uniref:hypothetical protein n=1 Tax=Streptomyces sp. NPDC058052 TaxID=3346316 RepID=UPI0036EDA855